MQIKLYKNMSPGNKINKDLREESVITHVVFKGTVSLEAPEVLLTNYRNQELENITTYNYMYIPSLNRYYFITDMKFVEGKGIIIFGRVDVLYTYREEIGNKKQLIERVGEYEYANKKIRDTQLPIRSEKIVKYKSFGVDVIDADNMYYVLQTTGGPIET